MKKVYLVGMPGSGKSKIGQLLSIKTGLPFFDLDDYLVLKEGRDINTIFSESGESYFRILERDSLKELTGQSSSFIMASGGGAPCFYDNMTYMNHHGITVFLNPPLSQIADRMLSRKGNQKRPLLKGLDDGLLLEELEKKLRDRLPYYLQADLEITLGLEGIEVRAQRILEKIERLVK